MQEKQGTAIIHVLGTTPAPQRFPFALVDAQVEIRKIGDEAADADEPSAGKGGAKRPPRHREECVATGITGSDGRYSTLLPEGTYQAYATFAGASGSSAPFHICGDDTIDATVELPLSRFTIAIAQTHCRGEYAAGDLCNLQYKKPTYVRITWPSGPVKTVALFASGATVNSLRPLAAASRAAEHRKPTIPCFRQHRRRSCSEAHPPSPLRHPPIWRTIQPASWCPLRHPASRRWRAAFPFP